MSLVAESDLNQPRMILPRAAGGLGMTAQWADDVHHALHAWLTGESQGYYADFAADARRAIEAGERPKRRGWGKADELPAWKPGDEFEAARLEALKAVED